MINKNKILFLIRRSPPITGATTMNEFYYNLMSSNDNYVTNVIKLNNYSSMPKMGRLTFSNIVGFFKNYTSLFYKLIRYKPNLIYFEMAPTGIALIRDSFYLLLIKLFKTKVIVQFHAKGMSNYINNSIKFKYFRFIFKSTKVIILSKSLYPEYSKIINKQQVYYLPNRIDDNVHNKFKQIQINRRKSTKLNILFLSNMLEFKGPIDILHICDKLQKNKVDFKCTFVGDFDSQDYKNKFINTINRYELNKRCILVGSKFGVDKRKYFEDANVFIYPTHKDCFPLVILESFMYGIPVLTYNIGAIKDLISNNYLGYITHDKNYIDIYTYLIKHEKKIISLKYANIIRSHFLDNYLSECSKIEFIEIINKELKNAR